VIRRVTAASIELTLLLLYLEEHTDVFDDAAASILLEQGGFEHPIETTANSLYKPLYNLSKAQLKALRDYLANTLRKG